MTVPLKYSDRRHDARCHVLLSNEGDLREITVVVEEKQARVARAERRTRQSIRPPSPSCVRTRPSLWCLAVVLGGGAGGIEFLNDGSSPLAQGLACYSNPKGLRRGLHFRAHLGKLVLPPETLKFVRRSLGKRQYGE